MSAQTSVASARSRSIPTGPALVRLVLRLDALVTGANGLAYLVAAGPLAGLFGLPSSGLRAIGAFLVAFAAAVWLIAARPEPRAAAVWAVVAANILWAVDSLVLVALGWWSTVGDVWIVMQAAVVGLFAALQAASSRLGRRIAIGDVGADDRLLSAI